MTIRVGAGGEQAMALFERAMGLYESVGETHAAVQAKAAYAFAMQLTGRIDDAIELMERTAAEVADDQPDADIGLLLARLGQA